MPDNFKFLHSVSLQQDDEILNSATFDNCDAAYRQFWEWAKRYHGEDACLLWTFKGETLARRELYDVAD